MWSSRHLQSLDDHWSETVSDCYGFLWYSIVSEQDHTLAKALYYVRHGRYVMPGICLSVCLLATSHKNYWMDLHENFTTDVSVHKEELLKFWKLSASGSRNFVDSSTLQDRAFFHSMAYISRESDWIFMKIVSQHTGKNAQIQRRSTCSGFFHHFSHWSV